MELKERIQQLLEMEREKLTEKVFKGYGQASWFSWMQMEMIRKNKLLQIVKGVQPCLLQHVLEMEVGNIEASQEALQVGPNFMMLVKTDGDDS